MANLSNINNILRISSSGVGLNKDNTGPSELDIESAGADMIDITRTGKKTYRLAISGTSDFSIFDVAADSDRLIISSGGDGTFTGSVTGVRLFSGDGGNKTNPMIANGSDQDTGIFFPSSNTMAFSAGDTESFRIAGANATFSGIVGIGSTGIFAGSAAILNLQGIGIALKNDKNGSNNNWSYIQNTGTGGTSDINFYTGNNSSALNLSHSGLATFKSSYIAAGSHGGEVTVGGGSTDFGIAMKFNQSGATSGTIYCSSGYTNSGTTLKLGTGSNTNQLVLKGDGNVGIGTSSPDQLLDIKGANAHNKIKSYFSGTYISGFTFSDGNGGIWYDAENDDLFVSGSHANSQVIFNAGGSEKMRILANGNVGIGEPNAHRKLNVASGTNGDGIYLSGLGTTSGMATNNYKTLEFAYSDTDTSFGSAIRFEVANDSAHGGKMSFWTDNSSGTLTRAITVFKDQRVSSIGSVHAGHDGSTGSSGAGTATVGSTLGDAGFITAHRTNATCLYIGTTTDREVMAIFKGTSQAGKIRISGNSSVAFESGSDYRLKEDLKDFNGLDIISKLKVYDFNWIDENRRDHGLLAHEVQEILPDLVSGKKDGVLENGKIDKQTLDYGRFTPMLIKAIQEQQTIIEDLKSRIETLEG